MSQPPAAPPSLAFDPTKFVHPAQAGGIERYVIDDGAGRGIRALCVNTGGGLRYRLLPDRGLDVDQAYFGPHSLAFLSHRGPSAPAGGIERGIDWLGKFPGGLLTSCGPFGVGAPVTDAGEDLPLHGPHSNTPAEIESVVQPDPHAGRLQMSVTGVLRYGRLFGPNVTLRRTVRSTLGANAIEVTDEFTNPGNTPAPHAWLLHINLGYPLVDAGATFCYRARVEDGTVQPLPNPVARARFTPGGGDGGRSAGGGAVPDYKRVPPPLDAHRGAVEAVAYLTPKAGPDSQVTVGLVNDVLGLGLAIDYDPTAFPRCVNWQHWGPGEYVTALEPTNGSVEGRATDRANGTLDSLPPRGSKTYRYTIRVVSDAVGLDALRTLNT
ncbi:MAG: hypothetical protein JWO31_1922 [Phycisphaerales bacterium]|nr:hypothetical protein [Phycisphaerales bacterium]